MNDDFVIIKNTLVRYKGTNPFVEIPDGVTCIGEQAFYYQDIQSVSIPDGVTSIERDAFSHCERLYEIELPNSLRSIESSTFDHCGSVEVLDLPCNLSSIGSSTFAYCWNLKSISFPDSLKSIGGSAFIYTDIEEVQIPDSVSVIEGRTFESCRRLRKVTLPKNLKSVEWQAFSHCNELNQISFPPTLCEIGENAFDGCKCITDKDGFIIINNNLVYYHGNDRVVKIPEGVKIIIAGAFENKERLVKIELPKSLIEIGRLAFYGCHNLRSINITQRIKSIASNAFLECKKIADANGFVVFNQVLYGYYGQATDIIVPDGIKKICTQAFICNNQIEKITIPESVEIIEESAFSCCRNLVDVVMPKRLKDLGREAFQFCDKLYSIKIPDGVEVLRYKTFDDCKKLKEIYLPSSLKDIEYMAINSCPSLEKIVIPRGVKHIGDGQFDDCDWLYEINIPDTVTSFEECDLKGVQLNISRYGKVFKAVLRHKWSGQDESMLWKMMKKPSLGVFNSIKTSAYKVALAERLYPEHKEYGDYLKGNIYKAIRDLVSFDDQESIDSLRNSKVIDEELFDNLLSKAKAENSVAMEDSYSKAKQILLNDSNAGLDDLKQLKKSLYKLAGYKDSDELMQVCLNKITEIENHWDEKKYKEAVKDMNSYGGMCGPYLGYAIRAFQDIRHYKDSDKLLQECNNRLEKVQNGYKEEAYRHALSQYNSYDGRNREELEEAIDEFERLEGYKDSGDKLREYYMKYYCFDIYERRTEQ